MASYGIRRKLYELFYNLQGGSFFRREKMYYPDVEFFVPKEPPSYTQQDMWIGNELVINKHRFRLIAADEYALRYMELHPDEVYKYPEAIIPSRY